MRRKLAAGFFLFLALGLTGCATLPSSLQRKFTRKKKEPLHRTSTVYLDQGPQQKQFSNEYYYKTHFTFWKTWHDDLLASLDGNSKKLKRASEEAYSHLEQMSRYLKPEKQAELKPLLEELGLYRKKFSHGDYASAGSIRPDLERLKRLVSNDFYFEKVKEDVLPDVVDLGGA